MLAREWRGRLERVTVLEEGFAWNGNDLWQPVAWSPRRSPAQAGTAIASLACDPASGRHDELRRRRGRESGAVVRAAVLRRRREAGKPKASLRCAIYTRVSSDSGLEQEFNSLDNQREASEAYIKSQAHEGWMLIRDRYDDGGFSGGSMERPALQKLLEDVEQGRIDVIVVYKVDRLTRSLADFAKLVELFDAHGVVVRLGDPGLQHDDQHGAADAQRAAVLRPVRARGHGRAHPRQDRGVEEEGHLDGRRRPARLSGREPGAACRRGARRSGAGDLPPLPRRSARSSGSKRRSTARTCVCRIRIDGTGKTTGGGLISRGHLHKILSNPIYVGRLPHKGRVYDGQHEAIIDAETWDRVQALLADHTHRRNRTVRSTEALLAGKLYDDRGHRMSPSEVSRGSRRWRYYVSQAILQGRKPEAGSIPRLAAAEIEDKVLQAVRSAVGPDADSLSSHNIRDGLERVAIGRAGLTIELNDRLAAADGSKIIQLPWTPRSPRRRREIVQGDGSRQTALRPMRSEARSRFAIGLRNARHWLDQLVADSGHLDRIDRGAREAHGTLDPPDPFARLPGSGAGRGGAPRPAASGLRAQAAARPSGRLARTMDEARPRGPCPPLIVRELDLTRRRQPRAAPPSLSFEARPRARPPCAMPKRETELRRVRLSAGVRSVRPDKTA